MKKIILILYIMLFFTGFGFAQNINTVFLNIPDNIIIGLSNEDKQLLVSFVDGTDDTVENVFSGEIKRLRISDDFIELKTSEAGTTQIKLLSLINNSKIICVTKTVCGKACDSYVSFFTTDWDTLGQAGLFPEKDINWFIKEGVDKNSEEFKNAVLYIDMFPVKLSLSDSDSTIRAEFIPESYMTKENYEKIKPFLNPVKIFTWNNIVFKN